MKCPKCGYLGFEASERCRNCGYEFSLSVDVTAAAELPLQPSDSAGPFQDLDLVVPATAREGEARTLDLDRIIGTPPPPASTAENRENHRAERVTARRGQGAGELPLFRAGEDDTPLITAPRPARPPLAVRRTTPEIPRVRPRSPVTPARPLQEELDPPAEAPQGRLPGPDSRRAAAALRPARLVLQPAGVIRRLVAAVLDLVLLAFIDAAVVYLTLALAGLTWEEYAVLPLPPLLGFLAILNAGYLITFIAASGQTIGKMLTGIRVVGDDGRRVEIGGAVLRALGCAVSLITVGAAYIPFFFTTDRRTVQDRISGTQVVSAR